MSGAAVTSADVCTDPAAPAPKPAPTFEQLPLASCSLSPREAGRWLNVINPLLKYAGSPGDWGRESKLGVLTMRLMQARAELSAMESDGVHLTARDVQAFAHIPRPPVVYKDHPDQRHFGRDDSGSTRSRLGRDFDTSFGVMRFCSRDVAVFGIETGSTVVAETRAKLNPQQLREIAQLLLDAAHDIEAYPSAQLLAELDAARGAA